MGESEIKTWETPFGKVQLCEEKKKTNKFAHGTLKFYRCLAALRFSGSELDDFIEWVKENRKAECGGYIISSEDFEKWSRK